MKQPIPCAGCRIPFVPPKDKPKQVYCCNACRLKYAKKFILNGGRG